NFLFVVFIILAAAQKSKPFLPEHLQFFTPVFVHHYSNPPRFPWAGTAWPHISRGVFLSCIPQ
ncbi:hypothetical protein, partial [Intestinimonas butyriciproducens]|uniref:hypothetical protein n=1 Tax=Intestinimonas butyriciproducens TaxID=1297617 RepID=UPI0019D33490